MSREEQIIREHIQQITERMDGILAYELYMADNDCPLPAKEAKELDFRWEQLQNNKVELMSVLAEIQDVPIEDLVL